MDRYDIIVVGAGPAGMTAALNCLRAGKSVLVLESDSFGGQISFSPRVENFPSYQKISGAELMDKLYEQISEWGAQIELEKAQSIVKTPFGFELTTDYNTYECKSVILATGVKPRKIGIEREDELVGSGVSYCALCDGAFYSGEDVCVIGDANTALQYALVLSGYCKSVHICTLFDKFFGDKALLDLVLARPNVRYTHNLALKEFIGEDELSALRFENTQTHENVIVDAKCAFICIGQVPNNTAFANLVELDKAGYIVADENCTTSCEGIFVAGDCRTKKYANSLRRLPTVRLRLSTHAPTRTKCPTAKHSGAENSAPFFSQTMTIFIDVDNTILDFDKCANQSITEACDFFGIPKAQELCKIFHPYNLSLWQQLERKELTLDGLLEKRFNTLFDMLGIRADGHAFEDYFHKGLASAAVAVDGAKDLLEYLSSKYDLYVASNAPLSQQKIDSQKPISTGI